VTGGAGAPLEGTTAGVAVAMARIELGGKRRQLEAARKRLGAMWGSRAAGFERVEGDFYEVRPLPALEEVEKLVKGNPDVARWETELAERRAALAATRAQRISNLSVTAGTQYFSDEGETAFVMGLGMALPLFDRKEGEIQAAAARLSKAREEGVAAELGARTAMAEAYAELAAAHDQAAALEGSVIPAAEAAFAAAREGYLQGKFGYLEVLDAQRTLFEVRGQYVEALRTYHKARVEMERLTGAGQARDRQGGDKQTGDQR